MNSVVKYRLDNKNSPYEQRYALPEAACIASILYPHHITLMFAIDEEEHLRKNYYKIITKVLEFDIVENTEAEKSS